MGSAGLIAAAIRRKRFANSLNLKVPVGLGRISYSLYLVHMPIIYVVSQTTGSSMSLPELCATVLVATIVAAELMARAVEFPLNDFGKRLSRTIPFTSRKSR